MAWASSRASDIASDAAGIAEQLRSCFEASVPHTRPYRYWTLKHALPSAVAAEIGRLPLAVARIGNTQGKRETHNSSRRFFCSDLQQQYPVCKAVAEAFQSPAATRAIERMCGIDLRGSHLRIEYCQDQGDFWLEPHTDIAIKRITLQVFIGTDSGAETLGTTIYDPRDFTVFGHCPSAFNEGMVFVPAADTIHGFERRTINGVRKSLLINYVGEGWNSTHELCYPGQPVGH